MCLISRIKKIQRRSRYAFESALGFPITRYNDITSLQLIIGILSLSRYTDDPINAFPNDRKFHPAYALGIEISRTISRKLHIDLSHARSVNNNRPGPLISISVMRTGIRSKRVSATGRVVSAAMTESKPIVIGCPSAPSVSELAVSIVKYVIRPY